MAAIAACNGALDRIDGKPVARTRNQSRTTTLGEMILEAVKRGHCMIARRSGGIDQCHRPDGQPIGASAARHMLPGNGVNQRCIACRLSAIAYFGKTCLGIDNEYSR